MPRNTLSRNLFSRLAGLFNLTGDDSRLRGMLVGRLTPLPANPSTEATRSSTRAVRSGGRLRGMLVGRLTPLPVNPWPGAARSGGRLRAMLVGRLTPLPPQPSPLAVQHVARLAEVPARRQADAIAERDESAA